MNRRDWREIFEIINDPGTPILFLIGIMIFAILGNGLYDLLVVTIQRNFDDEGNFTYVIIIATASLLLLAIIFVLWLWFNLRWKRRNRLPNNIKLEQTYPILIIFVSANPKASEPIAVQHHLADGKLQKLWLIASRESESRAKWLSEWVNQHSNQPVHVEAEYQALIAALRFIQRDFPGRRIRCLTDSRLVVDQLSGIAAVRDETLRVLHQSARVLIDQCSSASFELIAIPRDLNRLADALA